MNSAGTKATSFLLGVGVTQILAYPYLKQYHEQSQRDMQKLLREHQELVDEAAAKLSK